MVEQKRIFLGHASEDKPRVRELYLQLTSRGFSPWLDAVDLIPGQNWRIEIPNAIKDAGVFLACLSTQSVAKRSYVQREFRYALSAYAEREPGSIFLIPIRLDDCEVPDLRLAELELNLRDLHWVDLFEPDGFERLVLAIEHALGPTPADKADDPSLTTPPPNDPPSPDVDGTESSKPAPTVSPAPTTSRPEPSEGIGTSLAAGKKNPTVTAAWIGAAAVIVAGIFTSPWLADLMKPSSEPDPIEPAAAPEEPSQAVAPMRQPFETFRDCARDVCPEMVMLPAGTFTMGSPADEKGRYEDEGPQHEVTISRPFAIGKTEVAFKEYDAFADATGREKPDDRGWGRGDRPVINVSWSDADAYCDWLGEGYRLPTEAEWEYAARAGTTTPFSFGETITTDQVNYSGSEEFGGPPTGEYRGQTVPVGSLPANPWGLHEMHGNVFEWVSDWKADYPSTAVTDPQGPATGAYRVVRGGSWVDYAGYVRSASRSRNEPGLRYDDLGFRCAGVQES